MRAFQKALLLTVFLTGCRATAPSPHGVIDWVGLPGGSFMMGTMDGAQIEQIPHRVEVADFEMARTEVTFTQFQACVDAKVCAPSHTEEGRCFIAAGNLWEYGPVRQEFLGPDHPVICVSWEQARDFSEWVGGRLPTEAEWEYAAKSGGKERSHPWGDELATCERVVMDDGGRGCGRNATWPVCSKPAGNTDQGLCDMMGNVYEWTADWYHKNYAGAPVDGSAWLRPVGTNRVRRGGGWSFGAFFQRTTSRTGSGPGYRYVKLGFRPVRSR